MGSGISGFISSLISGLGSSMGKSRSPRLGETYRDVADIYSGSMGFSSFGTSSTSNSTGGSSSTMKVSSLKEGGSGSVSGRLNSVKDSVFTRVSKGVSRVIGSDSTITGCSTGSGDIS